MAGLGFSLRPANVEVHVEVPLIDIYQSHLFKITHRNQHKKLQETGKVEAILEKLQKFTLVAHKHQLLRILDSILEEWPEFINQEQKDEVMRAIPTENEEFNRQGYLKAISLIGSL